MEESLSESVFTKIMRREIPAEIVHEDEECVAFRDIEPQAPVHILVVPRLPLPGIQSATPTDRDLVGHLMIVAGKLAVQEGISDTGYRLVVNAGTAAGQTVDHLHVHLLGGRPMTWPPG